MQNVDPYDTLFAFGEVEQGGGGILKKSFCFVEEYTAGTTINI